MPDEFDEVLKKRQLYLDEVAKTSNSILARVKSTGDKELLSAFNSFNLSNTQFFINVDKDPFKNEFNPTPFISDLVEKASQLIQILINRIDDK